MKILLLFREVVSLFHIMIQSKQLCINGRTNIVHTDGSLTYINAKGGRSGAKGSTVTTRGTTAGRGYRYIRINGKNYAFHRIIAKTFLSSWDDSLSVDHINGDTTDNRIENLRMATPLQQNRGFQRKRKNCTSIYRGVCWAKEIKRWKANIKSGAKLRHLGCFGTEVEAARAFDKAAIEAGFFTEALNFKPEGV